MKTFEDFLNKVRTINWGLGEEPLTGGDSLTSIDGEYELSYRIDEVSAPLFPDDMPLQVLIHVRHKGQVVGSWGCETNEDNAEFLKWMRDLRAMLNDEWFVRDSRLNKLAKEKWGRI